MLGPCLSLLFFVLPVRAQVDSADEEARNLYEAGEEAFGAARYEAALEHFRASYELSHRPELLYNIGITADRLGRNDEALEAFRGYLASDAVDEARRPDVEARVAALEQPAVPAARSEPDPTTPIVLAVTGGALVALSVVLIAVGATENQLVQDAPPGASWADYAGHQDTATGLLWSGGIAAGLGVGLVLAGVVGLVLPAPSSDVSLSIGPAGLSVRGRL